MKRSLLIFGAAVLAAGCKSDLAVGNIATEAQPNDPQIVVAPPALTFGTLMTGEVETQQFTIDNVGVGILDVDDITIEGVQAYTITSQKVYSIDSEVEDSMVTIEVEFTPMGVDNVATAVVHSNDPDEPETIVELNGFGAVPELTITPENYDFGDKFIPCSDIVELNLANTGEDTLTIDSISLLAGTDYALFDDNVLPLSLAPGESRDVEVQYTPMVEGETGSTLQVISNDPRGLVEAFQVGTAQYAAFGSDTFIIPTDPPVDIMFAVDQSCSMDSHSQNLGSNFQTFINSINAATDGWRIGVPNMDSGCFNSGSYIDSSTPNYTGVFSGAVLEGYDGSGDASMSERLLEMADVALAKTGPGQCNQGFLRAGALLHIVLVTDEPNYSPQAWTQYLGNYEGFVSDPSLIKVSGLLGLGNCGQGTGDYPNIIAATGGITFDVCGNWGPQIADLGAASLQGVSNFELGQQADEPTISVTVDGVPRTDWTFDQGANQLDFGSPLDPGSEVIIDYGVAVGCASP